MAVGRACKLDNIFIVSSSAERVSPTTFAVGPLTETSGA
jgi:hypothetical protein